MTLKRLIRWSGWITCINGILLLGFGILPYFFLPVHEPLVKWVNDSHWFVLNLSAFILTVLTPLSILGLYAKQFEKNRKDGLFRFSIGVSWGSTLYCNTV